MKKLLLLLLCVSSFHMFSQNAPIDFETPGMGSNLTGHGMFLKMMTIHH